MTTLGPNDLKQYALPANWDPAYLSQIALADGTIYEQFVDDVATALSLVNQQLLADPFLSSLISLTTEASVEYRTGVSNGFEEATEYGRPDAKRGATTGHMLPLKEYDRALGWTWMFLRKARRAQLDADIASAVQDVRDLWAKKILTRLFKSTSDTVGTGKSVPFADGGTADPNYIPPPVPDRGGTFDSSHNHFLRLSGITQANLETAIKHLWEHGHNPPFDLIIAQADISSWTDTSSVTGYVPRPDPLLRYGTNQDLANVTEDFIGAIETDYGAVRVRANGRIPANYWGVFKSYGPLDQRNPLRVRYNPRLGIGVLLLAGDHIREYPLENAIMWMEFGVGVGEDRTAAALVRQAGSGSYTDPTIS